MQKEDLEQLDYVHYAHGSYAYYDPYTDTYYNDFGQELRNPNEYNEQSEGYTPFWDDH